MGDTVRLFTKVFEPTDAHPHGGYMPVGPLNPLPVSGTFGGITARVPVSSGGATESGHVLKASSGSLFSLDVVIGQVNGWAMLFDAVAPPADGAVSPLKVWPIASDGISGYSSRSWSAAPLAFLTGIVCVFSSTGPLVKTASATALFSGEVA